jgi:hypothetical protein
MGGRFIGMGAGRVLYGAPTQAARAVRHGGLRQGPATRRRRTRAHTGRLSRLGANPCRRRTMPAEPRPLPPEKPLPTDCCGSGCAVCVNDAYDEALHEYAARLAAWRSRQPAPRDERAE